MFELAPWRPISELSNLRKEMDRLWSEFFREGEIAAKTESWVPAVDVSETKDAVIVKAEIPGMDPKDIDVSLSGDTLIIKGEKKEEKEEKDENFYRIEMRRGSFQRAVRIPVPVNKDKIEAKYEKGILKVKLPKTEETKPKQIEVKVS